MQSAFQHRAHPTATIMISGRIPRTFAWRRSCNATKHSRAPTAASAASSIRAFSNKPNTTASALGGPGRGRLGKGQVLKRLESGCVGVTRTFLSVLIHRVPAHNASRARPHISDGAGMRLGFAMPSSAVGLVKQGRGRTHGIKEVVGRTVGRGEWVGAGRSVV